MCGSHVTLLWLWTVLSVWGILLHHCGFDAPLDDLGFGSMAQMHDFHHARFNSNFGIVGVLDWMHSTDHGFKEHVKEWTAQRKDGSREWEKRINPK